METLYVVVNDYFIPIYCILPKKCVVKEISISKRWIRATPAVLDEPEQKTDTISVPIPQCEESENIPLSDFPEQPENVQRPGSEVVEKGMLT